MTINWTAQPGGHPKGDEVFSDSAFLLAMCGLSVPEKAQGAVPHTKHAKPDAKAKGMRK